MSSSVPRKPSKSAAIRARLDYPVIDTDLHTIEFAPLLEDYIAKFGGPKSVDEFRAAINRGFGYLSNEWYELSKEQRAAQRSVRPPCSPGTADQEITHGPRGPSPCRACCTSGPPSPARTMRFCFRNVSTFATHVGDPELRRALIRAVNESTTATSTRPIPDRLTPVAAIPLHTPEEGIVELEYAIKTLGLKVALIPGNLRRPIKAIAEKYPSRHHPEVARHANWLDTFGVDSEHDYDPFWAKAVELRTVLTTHSAGMGWTSRSSWSNYMYNHIGHFASASEALAKSLFFSGVTRRFPDLRVGFLEGGAAWGATLYADLVGHWEKRNSQAIQNYNPEAIDAKLLYSLYQEYGGKEITERLGDINAVLGGALGVSNNSRRQPQEPDALDDFARAGVHSPEDIRDRYVPNFYFGSEADDPTVAYAFNTKVNPLGVQVNAFWASDSGHWDVPDLTEVLSDTWSLVERGALSEANFRDLVFTHPYNFFAGKNPEFFKGTQVEQKLSKVKAA